MISSGCHRSYLNLRANEDEIVIIRDIQEVTIILKNINGCHGNKEVPSNKTVYPLLGSIFKYFAKKSELNSLFLQFTLHMTRFYANTFI